MVNSRASRGMTLLETHLATGTENSFLHTPSNPIIHGQYKFIKILISGYATAAFELQLKISALATGYYSENITGDSATASSVTQSNTAFVSILPITIIDKAGTFMAEITLGLTDAHINILYTGHARAEGTISGGSSVADTTIDSIELKTSTSTWAANTTISLWAQK